MKINIERVSPERMIENYIYLRNKETQQTKIFFACLNDGLVKSLLKLSYWVFLACDEIPKRHFNATFYATS